MECHEIQKFQELQKGWEYLIVRYVREIMNSNNIRTVRIVLNYKRFWKDLNVGKGISGLPGMVRFPRIRGMSEITGMSDTSRI